MSFSHWNYRVVEDAHGTFRIMEVYYDENEEVSSWSDACAPEGDTIDEFLVDRDNQYDCLYETFLHFHETEDEEPTLVPWREDGKYQ